MLEASTAVRFVPLTPEQGPRYNAFLSEGCLRHPDALRIAPADIAAAPFALLDSSEGCTLAALSEAGEWLGVGTVEREQGRAKRRHIAWILRMYVAVPGRGIGRALLEQLKLRATGMVGVTKLNLTVAEHNAAAVGLYRSLGFVEFSREPDAFCAGPHYVTELSMSCGL
jgi:GNAT superfamily N-acetyltransferase